MPTNPNLRNLLARAAAGEDIDELADEAAEEAAIEAAAEREREAYDHLGRTIDRYSYDATGQDGEQDIESAADDLIRARDASLKALDPEWYNERRQMGLLG